MRIERLPEGQRAADDVDCIHIEAAADGRFLLTGSGLAPAGEASGAESVAIISGRPYESFDAAESAGLAWADGLGVEHLYISRG